MKQNILLKQFFNKKVVLIKQNISIKCVCVCSWQDPTWAGGCRLTEGRRRWEEEGGRKGGGMGGQAIWEGIGYEVNLQSELIEVNLK